ncbi:MAG: hypothetical protein KF851_00810 [Pirellulaceae bacterium]|nr:hypothetical protein [Pirellulaceae bacterium]
MLVRFPFLLMCCTVLVWALPGVMLPCDARPAKVWQDEDGQEEGDDGEKQDEEKKDKDQENSDEKKQDEEPLIELTIGEQIEIGPREVRLALWDGSVIRGNLGFSTLHVQTKFGRLEIPVENIVTLRPGLNSLPTIHQRVVNLIEQLGDKEFKVREKAKLELLALGPQILNFVKSSNDGNSAERKKNLQFVIDAIGEQMSELDGDSASQQGVLAMEDTITTGHFTIVGQIEEKQYELTTLYGILNVRLEDIQLADRNWASTGEAIEKKVEVDAAAFFQRAPVSTKIRVNAGDRITIRAEGSANWASWGNVTSGPDGIASHGAWNGFNCGMLVARIGKGSDFVGIGAKGTFVAKTSGELFLGVSMQDNYANQRGYQWNGSYKATVRVESSGK